MPLKSDIIIDAGKFDPANNPERVNKFNETITALFNSAVDWYEVGLPSTLLLSVTNAA